MSFNHKIESISKNPYTIFKIENFLNQNLYEEIENNFPLTSDNLLNNYYKDMDRGKFWFHSDDILYQELKQKYNCMKKLEEIVFSEKFFRFFYYNFFVAFFKSVDFKQFLKRLRIPKILMDKEKMKTKNLFFNYVRPRIEYSYLTNGAYLRPHVDSKAKLLSLMLYFPNNSEKFDIKSEKNFGTQFWLNKEANPKNYHINDIDKFEKTSSKYYKSSFEKNLLVGFVRNKYSWHSLEKIECQREYVRRSININFFVR